MPIPNHSPQAPIGIFDSGVGGLSIYQHITQLLPHEHCVYYADTLNVPYGGRDKEDIITLTLLAVEKLYALNCKLIVIACNSASAYALNIARKQFADIPIIGLVPALKPAVFASKSQHVAVLATKATLAGDLLQTVIRDIAIPRQIHVSKYYKACLVPWVEDGMPKESMTTQILRELLNELQENNVDQLVLGCTHYPFFRQFLQDYIDQHSLSISIVDSGTAIALRVKHLLETKLLLNTKKQVGTFYFYTSHYTHKLQKSLDVLLDTSCFNVELKLTADVV